MFIDEQYVFPRLTAVSRTKHTTRLLGAIAVAHGRGENNIRVGWVDHDPANAARRI